MKKIMGDVGKLPAKYHSQSIPFSPKLGWIGCTIYQATSKRLPGFFILFLFFEYKTIETHARAFLPLNISAVVSVGSMISYFLILAIFGLGCLDDNQQYFQNLMLFFQAKIAKAFSTGEQRKSETTTNPAKTETNELNVSPAMVKIKEEILQKSETTKGQ